MEGKRRTDVDYVSKPQPWEINPGNQISLMRINGNFRSRSRILTCQDSPDSRLIEESPKQKNNVHDCTEIERCLFVPHNRSVCSRWMYCYHFVPHSLQSLHQPSGIQLSSHEWKSTPKQLQSHRICIR
jgi:hypothetical protein